MAKDEYSSYQTGLTVDQIRRALNSALSGADVSPLEMGLLDDASALPYALAADARWA